MFPLQMQICFILPYNQIIKTNNQIIKTNNQIFKITVLRIRPRLTDVGNKEFFKQIQFSVLFGHLVRNVCLLHWEFHFTNFSFLQLFQPFFFKLYILKPFSI